MDMIERDHFWWPADDNWCWKVIHSELSDCDEAVKYTRGKTVAVQAGGNVGVWASHLAKTFRRVETTEPMAVNYECLKRNVPENVSHRFGGFGDKPGFIGMVTVEGNAGAHYPKADGDIPVVTIDSLNLEACDLLILDVEGYEPFALKGAEETIRKYKPVVMIEEKGLSERYYGVKRGTAENWVIGLGLGYAIRKKVRADVILSV
jgi:FkbM family methyltransferase